MTQVRDIMKKSESIIRYIEEQAKSKRPATPEDILPVMYSLQQVFPQWVFMICPAHHPEWYFVSDNCQQLFGYTSSEMVGNLPPAKFLREIHNDDVDDLYKAMTFVGQFMENEVFIDHHKYRMIFQYRFRRRDGSYAFVHDEKAIFQTSGGGNLYYALFRDITYETEFTGVKVEIYKQDIGLKKVAEYKPSDSTKLSNRESQLIGLIKKGLTTKEIAHHLSISHNTVRNIRSRMFEKYNVNNVIELLNRAG